jgi:type II secretory ATPase GspE/PulE/Tfp pilus assembly ATPase PilB-like protein
MDARKRFPLSQPPPAARQPIPVGKYFLDRGKISAKQLELALRHRAEFGLKLGQSLVELGFVSEADMVEALRYQARFPCVHLSGGIVDRHVAAKVGEEVSRRLRALALNQIAGHTTVAMEDPSDVQALEELAHILATRIFPVYSEPSAIVRNLEHVFGPPRTARPRPPAGTKPAASNAPLAPRAATPVAPIAAPSNPPAAAIGAKPAPAVAETPSAAEAPPAERVVFERLRGFLQDAFAQGVSYIHLETRRDGTSVRFRVDGVLRPHSHLPEAWARATLACLKSLAKLEDEEGPALEGTIPFAFKGEPLELRVSVTPSLHGESLILQVLRGPTPQRPLGELGFDPAQLAALEDALVQRGGLFLVAGPAGAGRTTTLHALLARLAGPSKKAIALEERLAHEHEHVLHVPLDRVGTGYAAGARALLRQDPDLLLVGELTGRETAQVLFDAAQAGKGVLAALRTSGALATVAELRQHGLEPYLLAETLRCVVAQRLVRRVCPDCRAPLVPDAALRARLGFPSEGETFYEGQGCAACAESGYRGRIALFEVLTATPGLRHALERGGSADELACAARAEGFVTLREHGLALARRGATTLHEVLAATPRE